MTAPALTLRVWVPDVWDVVELTVDADRPLGTIKSAALTRAIGPGARPEDYEVKYRGAWVDETRTPAELEVPDGAPLIVLAARRRPVR